MAVQCLQCGQYGGGLICLSCTEKNDQKNEFKEAIKSAYFEGYSDGQSDGSATSGCRGCYEHDPVDDVNTAWNESMTKEEL